MFFEFSSKSTFLFSLRLLFVAILAFSQLVLSSSNSLALDSKNSNTQITTLKSEISKNINLYLERKLPHDLNWSIELPEHVSYLEEKQSTKRKIQVLVPQENLTKKVLVTQLKITDQDDQTRVVAVPVRIFRP